MYAAAFDAEVATYSSMGETSVGSRNAVTLRQCLVIRVSTTIGRPFGSTTVPLIIRPCMPKVEELNDDEMVSSRVFTVDVNAKQMNGSLRGNAASWRRAEYIEPVAAYIKSTECNHSH